MDGAKSTELARLTDLAAAIEREHQQVGAALNVGIEHARKAGEFLLEAKAELSHGQWLPWLRAHCTVSERTAQAYMRIAREWPKLDEAKAQRVADLSFRGALQLIGVKKAEAEAERSPHTLAEKWRAIVELFNPDDPGANGFCPLDDYAVVGTAPDGTEVHVSPSTAGGYYFVTMLWTEPGNVHAHTFVEGTKKPIRCDYVESQVARFLRGDPNAANWQATAGFPWEYNYWLFASPAHARESWAYCRSPSTPATAASAEVSA